MKKDDNDKLLERLDKQVGKLLFRGKKPRAYTSSRDLAACVLEKIALDCPKKVRDKFNEVLERRYGSGKVYRKGQSPPNHVVFLLEVCPVDICEAAVMALQSDS
jgi:hypothetical protein